MFDETKSDTENEDDKDDDDDNPLNLLGRALFGKFKMIAEADFKPFSGQTTEECQLKYCPSRSVNVILDLPKGAKVEVLAKRMGKPMQPSWYQVTYERRTGWLLTRQVEKVKEVKESAVVKKSLNFSGLSDREKDKIALFYKYDAERRERQFVEALGEGGKYLNRPIRNVGISRF